MRRELILSAALVIFATRATGVKDYFLLKLTRQPWAGDANCSDHRIGFITNRSQPLMALVSYPGSGNTWIRQLIEGLTGYFTGSVYQDMDLFAQGLYGEKMDAECGCTIVQKTHDYLQESGSKTTHFHGNGVLILRNPYKALISLRNYNVNQFDHLDVAQEEHFRGPDWNNFVATESTHWRNVALKWIRSIRKGGVIHYEDLLADREAQIRKLMEMLHLHVDERRLKCILLHDPMSFKRHSSQTFNPYTEEQRG